MIFWENILKNALLGTERLPVGDEIVPDDLREHFATVDRSDPELYLLKVLTLASVYQKSGQCAVSVSCEHFEPAAPENFPYCSPYATEIWYRVKELYQKHPHLLELYLEKIREKQWIVAPDTIVDLLTIALNKKGERFKQLALEVVGNRGKWLLQFHPEWTDITYLDYEHIFLTGKLTEKRSALMQIRKRDPTRARELFLKHCEKESPLGQYRLALALSVNFSEADRETVARFTSPFIRKEEEDPLLNRFQTNDELESKLLSLKNIPDKYDWGKLSLCFNWSPTFSVFILRQVYLSFQNLYFEKGKMFLPLAAYLHPSTNLHKIPDSGDSAYMFRHWEEFCKHINPVLDCKRAIEII